MKTANTVFYNDHTYTYAQADAMLRGWFGIDTWSMSQSFRDWHKKAVSELSNAMRQAAKATQG